MLGEAGPGEGMSNIPPIMRRKESTNLAHRKHRVMQIPIFYFPWPLTFIFKVIMGFAGFFRVRGNFTTSYLFGGLKFLGIPKVSCLPKVYI